MQQAPVQSENSRSAYPRILVVRLSAMGDVIHALPAVAALRQAFPSASIGWVIEERWAELLCTLPAARSGPRSPQRPLVDRIHTVNLKGWRRALLSIQTWEQMAAALSELRGSRYDIAVDFQGAARSALIARWSGAQQVYGFSQPRENVAGMVYTRQVEARGAHVVEQNLSLAAALAAGPLTWEPVKLPCDAAAEQECELRLRELGVQDFVLMNPGAGWGAKQWPSARYSEVAKRLAADGLKSLINFGPGEGDLARQVEEESAGAARRIACSLSQLVALTRRASLFIGGDTGPLHLAAALNVPVVGIYGPTNPARNGPFGTRSVVLRSLSSVTSHSRHAAPEEGLLEITPAQVIAASQKLLEQARD
ncbi:MAG TPA: lipopolysaccharide heptosyltransferase I [Terriglobales bacterium]